MEKIIVSIDGGNGLGKSTLLRKLVQSNSVCAQYELIDTELLDKSSWWFEESTPLELINEICRCLKLRNDIVENSQYNVVFLDKGLKTIEARIYATLKCRGMSETEIDTYISYFKEKCASFQTENISILLDNEIQYNADPIFFKYETFQRNYLKKMKFDVRFTFGNNYPDQTTEKTIFRFVYDFWLRKLAGCVEAMEITVFALSGLSECGKSTVGKYLGEKHNVWNLKLKYFNQIVHEQRKVQEDNIFYYLIYVEELIKFFNIHYYKKIFSLESFYGFDFLSVLRFIFKDKFKLIYIDAPYEVRLARSLVKKETLVRKDEFKKSVQVDELKELCDIIINNNGDSCDLYNQIDNLFSKEFVYRKNLVRSVDDLKIDVKFKMIITSIENELKSRYSHLLLLFSVVGSCGSETAILGWSDIDVFIIVKDFSFELVQWLNSLENKYDIHIGINCFSLLQISKMELDIKCKWYLYYIQSGRIRPSFVSDTLKTRAISFSDIVKEEAFYENELRFSINRLLINNHNTKKLFKDTVTLIKIHLRRKGFICVTLEEIFEKLYEIWRIDINQYISIKDLPKIDAEKTKKFAARVLSNV